MTLILILKIGFVFFIIFQYMSTAMKTKSLKNIFLYLALFVMLLYDVRRLMLSLPVDSILEILTMTIIVYIQAKFKILSQFDTFGNKEVEFQGIVLSEVIENVKDGIAIVQKENLNIIASNASFDEFVNQYDRLISVHDILSRFNRGEDIIELKGFENETHYYKLSMTNIDHKRIRIHIHDISEEKINEDIMVDTLDTYYHLIDQMQIAFILLDSEFNIIHANKRVYEIFEVEEVHQESALKVLDFSYFLDSLEKMKKTLSDSINSLEETKVFRFKGRIKSLKIKMSYIHKGKTNLIAVEIEDKTYEYRLKNRLNTMHELAVEIEGTPLLEDVYYDLVEQKPYFIGINLNIEDRVKEAYLNFIHDLSDMDRLILSEIRDASADERYIGRQLGKALPLFIYKVVRDMQNNPVGVVLRRNDMDVVNLKIESLGNFIIPHIREGVIVADMNKNIHFISEYMLRFMESDRENVLGQNISSFLKDNEELNYFLKENVNDKSKSLHFEGEIIAKNHKLLPVDVVAVSAGVARNAYLILIVRDTQDKNLYQMRFLESQNKYEQIINSLQDGIVEISLPERKVSIIQSITLESRFVKSVLTYYEWLYDIHADDRAKVSESIDIITSEKKDLYEFDYRVFVKGNWRWIRSSGKYIENSSAAFVLLVNRNIDEVKRIKGELEDHKFILAESEKITDMAHWRFDVGKMSFEISDNFMNVLKLTQNLGSISFDAFLEYIHPADRNYFKEKFYQMIWDSEDLDIVFRIIRHGSIRHVQIVGKGYRTSKAPEYAIGNIMDVTEKLSTEQKLQNSRKLLNTIIEQSPTGILVVKRLGNIEMINPEAIKILGIRDEFKMTVDFLKTYLTEHYETLDGSDTRIVNNNLFSESSFTTIYKGLRNHYIKLLSSPLIDEEGRYSGNIVIIVKISKGYEIENDIDSKNS